MKPAPSMIPAGTIAARVLTQSFDVALHNSNVEGQISALQHVHGELVTLAHRIERQIESLTAGLDARKGARE